MSVIDCSEMFTDIQKQVAFDRELSREFQIAFIELSVDAEIVIDGRMFAFIPDEE